MTHYSIHNKIFFKFTYPILFYFLLLGRLQGSKADIKGQGDERDSGSIQDGAMAYLGGNEVLEEQVACRVQMNRPIPRHWGGIHRGAGFSNQIWR